MKIKNILISQPAPADFSKSPYAELKQKYSINIDFYKFFVIESVTAREFRDSKVDILQHNAIVFSSKNTIDQFFNLVKELRLQIPETMKYFCTTESTALYLQKHIQYRKRKVFFVKNNQNSSITDLILKNREYDFLIPCGSDLNTIQYKDFFEKHAINYTQATVFNTISANLKEDIDISKYDMIVLFSPAGVQSLRNNYPDFEQGDNFAFGALGATTAATISEMGWTVHVMAPTPETPSITAALDIFLKNHANRRR